MLNGNGNLGLSKLAARTVKRRYDRGQILYMPGDPSDTVFVLQAGRVQQYHLSSEGRKLVTTILKPGDIFGATTLGNGSRRHVFAEALEDCVVQTLDSGDLRRLLLQDPKTALLLIEELGRRLNRAEDKLEALVFEPIPVRLARCLIEMGENGVVEGYSHQDLAELLGTYRETVTVALNEFKNQQLISIQRRRLTILNPEGLQHIAAGDSALRPRQAATPTTEVTEAGHRLAA